MYYRLIAFIFLICSSNSFAQQDLYLKKNETMDIKFKKDDLSKYQANYNNVVLEDGAILRIPIKYSNKKLKINISNLAVLGTGYLIFSYSDEKRLLHNTSLSFKDYQDGVNSRARRGADGAIINPPKAGDGEGDNGIRGNNGANGERGRNTFDELSLDINFKTLKNFNIIAVAESGGHGGNASSGQGGSDSKCDRDNSAGDGGAGGSGGSGGAPGSVGNIYIKWQSEMPLITAGNIPVGLNVKLSPGAVGNPGDGGAGGRGGEGVKCLLYRHAPGDDGAFGKYGSSIGADNEYFFLGRKGNITVINKDDE